MNRVGFTDTEMEQVVLAVVDGAGGPIRRVEIEKIANKLLDDVSDARVTIGIFELIVAGDMNVRRHGKVLKFRLTEQGKERAEKMARR